MTVYIVTIVADYYIGTDIDRVTVMYIVAGLCASDAIMTALRWMSEDSRPGLNYLIRRVEAVGGRVEERP